MIAVMKVGKMRADQLLADRGLAESRERAKRLIMAGQVFEEKTGARIPVAKPGQMLPVDCQLFVKESERFVSRGAYKLLTAIEHFNLDVSGAVALDAGASTGGFTDCLLQHGAARVYAADVGYGQLHPRLRSDPKVICLERVNLRLASPELIPEPVDIVAIDVSFISLKLILPPCLQWLKTCGRIIALIKPQFELGPAGTDRGVVRDEADQQRAVDDVLEFARDELGLEIQGVVPAKIKGPKGNQEYLAYFIKRT